MLFDQLKHIVCAKHTGQRGVNPIPLIMDRRCGACQVDHIVQLFITTKRIDNIVSDKGEPLILLEHTHIIHRSTRQIVDADDFCSSL
jgi:hypothetical protein